MKPSIPKGTRDFLPHQVRKRQFIFNTIKEVFKSYGYTPIETPTMESLSTLTGKYGEEGDRLIFKVLNNGDYLKKADKDALNKLNSKKLTSSISKRGLRYDLTVPFARYVVMHQNDISFPFKRYQIQPVWRADRPQKGRYQEFYQCDVDVVGSNSLMYEAELIQIYSDVFKRLNINVTILVNNRKVLQGICESIGAGDLFVELVTTIDKLDKIGKSGVEEQLVKLGLDQDQIVGLFNLLNADNLTELKSILKSDTGAQGIQELEDCFGFFKEIPSNLKFDISLARGLGYYTGCIFEVKANDVSIGSIGGGGRYDDLTGVFGLKNVSGVGISFGAARIYDVMLELDLFDKSLSQSVDVLITSFDQESLKHGFEIATVLRDNNLATEIYPDPTKMKKQMKYANDKNIPFVIIIGKEEINSGQLVLKNMTTGEQDKLPIEKIISTLA